MDTSSSIASVINGSASIHSSDIPAGDPYLQFQLNSDISAVLPMQHVQEVVVLPSHQLTAMPGMVPCVMGLMNRRSHILWVVDFSRMLGLETLPPGSQIYNIITLKSDTGSLGIAVNTVQGIIRLPIDRVQPVAHPSAIGLNAYLQGHIEQSDTIIHLFNTEAIVNSPVLQNPPSRVLSSV
jgi:twitching motility protein PilI